MLSYRLIPTADLIPYARNSRTHSDAQIAKIASSIREFGFINPVVTDGKNGIVAGHGRVMAANKLGLKEIPCVEASHLTEDQKRAYVIADNRMALDAGWDSSLLKLELGDLKQDGFDLVLTGFDFGELADIFKEPVAASPSEPDEDAVESYPCAVGDVFQIGCHVIACGDSSNPQVIASVLQGDKPRLTLYDPPFEVNDAWGWLHPAESTIVFCDYKTTSKAAVAGSAYAHCYHFVWDGVTSWYTPNRPLARHKSALVFFNDPKWDFDAAIYHDGKEREAKTVTNTRGASDYQPLAGGMVHLQTVFQFGNTRVDDAGHAHAKPAAWVRALMLGCGVKTADVVLDQFAGSGSFTLAAPDGVSVRSIELDPVTCGRAITRIAESVGSPPQRISGTPATDARRAARRLSRVS
jgi:hypothetical protein